MQMDMQPSSLARCKAALKPYRPTYRPCEALAQWYYPDGGWFCETHGKPKEDRPSWFDQPIRATDLDALEREVRRVNELSDRENYNLDRLIDYSRRLRALRRQIKALKE